MDELERPFAQRSSTAGFATSLEPSIAPPATFSVAKYLKNDFKHTLKIVLETRTFALIALPKNP